MPTWIASQARQGQRLVIFGTAVRTQNMSAEAAPCEASPWDTPPFSRAWEPGLLLPDNVCVHTNSRCMCILMG